MEAFCKESGKPVFATCLSCIDGRTHLPVIEWIKNNYSVDYIDLITEPGMVGAICKNDKDGEKFLFKNVSISVDKHNTRFIFISAHHDCAGNPVSDDEQKSQLIDACKKLKLLYPNHLVYGLWIDEKSDVYPEFTP